MALRKPMIEIDRYIAYSKINLGLEVLFKRADGYHELNTLFYRVMEPHDSISVSPEAIFSLTCSDDTLPTDGRNLMMKAANRFAEASGEELPAIHVHLEKQIPTGAGLGGGSSDAAVMLEILNDHAASPLGAETLSELAAGIGADVPFLLSRQKAMLAHGIGEKLSPIDAELDCAIVVVKDPATAVPTKDAYAGLKLLSRDVPTNYRRIFAEIGDLSGLRGILVNDFEASVFSAYPEIGTLKQRLYDAGADFALMSGSGAAVFGLFSDRDRARAIHAKMKEEGLQAFLNE